MDNGKSRRIFMINLLLALVLGLGWLGTAGLSGSQAAAVVEGQDGPQTPGDYPPDPTADTPWDFSITTLAGVEAAFNNARTQENNQLGISLPPITFPSQSEWDAMSDSEKGLWLINQERTARGVMPLDNVETNVTQVAQTFAEYLVANNAFDHYADGRSPWQRLDDNPAIGACSDYLQVAENLAARWTSGNAIPMMIESSVYSWMYDDSSSQWGHRHTVLWYPYNDNSGPTGKEGFVGFGRQGGAGYMNGDYGEVVVMNVFDPCSTWNYDATPNTHSISGKVANASNAPLAGVVISAGAAGSTTTAADGTYSLTNLDSGSYTLTPSKSGYTFTPTQQNVTIADADLVDVNFSWQSEPGTPGACLTPDEAQLGTLINEYRTQNGLPAVPWSKSLATVAQWHVWDLTNNNPVTVDCNLHSWSDQGIWTPVCYTSDHANAQGMWDKPKEITSGVFTGNGYEIAAMSSGTISPQDALNGWKSSPGHNDVILEQNGWDGIHFNSMGMGMMGNYAVVWFSDATDPQGTIEQCAPEPVWKINLPLISLAQ